MTIRAIFFDIDGTLVDSNNQHVLAWQEAFSGIGEIFDCQVIHDQIGKGTDMLVPALLPNLDAAAIEELGKAHSEIFRTKYLPGIQPFPRAHDLLALIHAAGQQVVLASSASAKELDHYQKLLDAGDLVSVATSGDDVENTKPAPDIFAVALERVAPLTSAEVIVVGDSPYDVEAARKSGIATVALRSGSFSDEVLRNAGAISLYDDVAELLAQYDISPLAAELQ